MLAQASLSHIEQEPRERTGESVAKSLRAGQSDLERSIPCLTYLIHYMDQRVTYRLATFHYFLIVAQTPCNFQARLNGAVSA